jgi:hypothetical protein
MNCFLFARKTKSLQPFISWLKTQNSGQQTFMVQAYNFLASWQLFPEKGAYENGERPKSGIYKVEAKEGKKN